MNHNSNIYSLFLLVYPGFMSETAIFSILFVNVGIRKGQRECGLSTTLLILLAFSYLPSNLDEGKKISESETLQHCHVTDHETSQLLPSNVISMLQVFSAIIAGIHIVLMVWSWNICVKCFAYDFVFLQCFGAADITWMNVSRFCYVYDLSLIYCVFWPNILTQS